MNLTLSDIKWWQTHENWEILEKYSISGATLIRTKKKYDIKNKRKSGSGGKSKPPKILIACKMCAVMHTNEIYCSRECQFKDEDFINVLKNINRSYMKTEEYSKSLYKPTTPEYRKYSSKVHRLTRKIYESNIDSINPLRLPRTVAGVDDGYQLDHIMPIKYGFYNNIPPEDIAKKENLRIIPWKENLIRKYNID